MIDEIIIHYNLQSLTKITEINYYGIIMGKLILFYLQAQFYDSFQVNEGRMEGFPLHVLVTLKRRCKGVREGGGEGWGCMKIKSVIKSILTFF